MNRKLIPWLLALSLVWAFSWPTGTLAHGDEDHGERPRGGCATTR